MAIRLSSNRLRLRNGRLALATPSATSDPGGGDPPPGATLTLAEVDLASRLFQRDALGGYNMAVSGTTTGTGAVQARAVDADTSVTVVDWTTVDAAPAGGSFSGTLRCPARIQPYLIEVRDSISTASTAKATKRFYVGAHWILWGQSNAAGWPSSAYRYPLGGKGALEYTGGRGTTGITAGKFTRIGYVLDTYPPGTERSGYGTGSTYPAGSSAQSGGTLSDGMVYMANALSQALGCAVCISVSALGGQPLSYWAPGAAGWTNLTAMLAFIGGDVEGSIMYQGEADADAVPTAGTYGNYKTALGARMGQFHSATGRNASTFKFVVVGLGAANEPNGYARSMGPIRAALVDFANETPGAFLLAANHDSRTTDGIHQAQAPFAHLGAAGSFTLASLYGVGPSGAGPRVVSASRSGAVITMNVQHAGGTALLDGAGGAGAALTGFRVFLASDTAKTSPLTIASTGIPSATTIRVTLAADPSAPVVIDYAMTGAPHAADPTDTKADPVWASAVYDNVALINQARGCILQPFAAITVTGS